MSHDRAESVVRRSSVHEMSDGRKVVLWSLTLQDWIAARDQSLTQYKREMIKTWSANADLIPESDRTAWVRQAFERAEKITYADLPDHTVKFETGDNDEAGEPLTVKKSVEHALYWMDTPEGQLHMVWLSMKKEPSQRNCTISDAEEFFTDSAGDLQRAAQIVHTLSQPKLGSSNGESDADPTRPAARPETKRERRRRKRVRRQTTGPS